MPLLVAVGALVAVGVAVQLQNEKTASALAATASAGTGSVPPADSSSTAQPDASVVRSQIPPSPARSLGTDTSIERCDAPAASGAATWKTYKSARYGYSICYPADAEVGAQTPATVDISFTESFDLDTGSIEDEFDFEINVHENPNGLSPRQWADTIPPGPVDIRDPHAVTVNGLPGYQVSRWEFDGSTVFVCVSGGPRMYVLSFPDPLSPSLAFPKALQVQYSDVFAEMLRTFSLR